MDFGERISQNISEYVRKTLPDKSDKDIMEIKYGIHVLINNLIKLPVIFGISYLTGLLNYTFAAFLSFSLIRIFASGIHARRSITCLISTGIIFLGSALFGKYISLTLLDITVSFVFCLTLAYFYAPADTEEKPFVSRRLRKKLKQLSCLIILVLYPVCLLLFRTGYASTITIAALIESLSLTPFTYLIFKRRYNNYEVFDN